MNDFEKLLHGVLDRTDTFLDASYTGRACYAHLVRVPGSGIILLNLCIWAEHSHQAVPIVIAAIQPVLNFRRNLLLLGLVVIQPKHFRTLHPADKIRVEIVYNQHCRKREAAKVRQLLEKE